MLEPSSCMNSDTDPAGQNRIYYRYPFNQDMFLCSRMNLDKCQKDVTKAGSQHFFLFSVSFTRMQCLKAGQGLHYVCSCFVLFRFVFVNWFLYTCILSTLNKYWAYKFNSEWLCQNAFLLKFTETVAVLKPYVCGLPQWLEFTGCSVTLSPACCQGAHEW